MQDEPCDVSDSNFVAALLMYGSYLILFVYFALEKYLFPSVKVKKGGKGEAKGKAAEGAAVKDAPAKGRSASSSKSKGQ